jgi:T5SS/PEP-CTERM-associated repeat protein
MNGSEKQFSFTRAAPVQAGAPKTKFLSVQEKKSPMRKTRRAYWFAGLLVATLLLGGSAAQAQYTDNYQTNIIDNVVSNWPGEYDIGNGFYNDLLIITNAGQLFNGVGYLGYNAGDNSNAALVTGAGSVWNNSGNLIVGYDGAGNTLTIANSGTVYDVYGYIGVGGISNAVTVTGAGSVWKNSSDLYVGDSSVGNTLTITNGGTVYNAACEIGYAGSAWNNAVTVTGAGSVWSNSAYLYVGGWQNSGNTLTIANGGTVYDAYCYIGYIYCINNAVTVTGAGSVWTNSDILIVGVYGGGNTLTISNGGAVYDTDGYISDVSDNNTVLVTGAGSVWNNSGILVVGSTGSGNTLTITDDGAVTVGGMLAISDAAGDANNSVNISGGQLTVTNGAINVGPAGSGQLNISGGTVLAQQLLATNGGITLNGGTLVSQSTTVNGQDFVIGDTVAGATFVALGGAHTFQNNLDVRNGTLTFNGGTVAADQFYATNGASSVVNFNGGTLNTKATTVANGSPFIVGDGTNAATLNLQGGTHNFANGLVISAAAQASGAATINSSVTSSGTVSSGASVGVMTILGNYTQNAGGALNIELGGIGSNDVLAVSGNAQLGGTLNVTNLNGFRPVLSNAFTILTAQTVTGTFASTNLPALGGAFDWSVTYASTAVVLRVVNGTSPYALWTQAHIPDPSQRYMDQDADGDGSSNWQEYVADTDPTNAASYFRVTAISNLPPLRVYFLSSSNRQYTLQCNTNLVTGVWTNIPGQGPRDGAGGPDWMQDTNFAPARFYRMNVSLPSGSELLILQVESPGRFRLPDVVF